MSTEAIYLVTIWVIPVIVAITFQEAAHGFVARLLGDDTAWRLGRVSFNTVRHIDPFGTILLAGHPAFGARALPVRLRQAVPVDFRALRSPRHDMILVAAAGPAMNIAIAIAAGVPRGGYLPATSAQWLAANCGTRRSST
jgi:Zn-dependent protease